MSQPQEPPTAKLLMGFLFTDLHRRKQALEMLCERFGPLDFLSQAEPFLYTDYYQEEMGEGIHRQVATFLNLVSQEQLPEIKHITNDMEKKLSVEGERRVNIDPGLLSPERLVLATGKNFTHRIYLGKGIYGDLTLLYKRGAYRPLPWTYPDYREPRLLHYLGVIRRKLQFQHKGRLPRKGPVGGGEVDR
ncbi:MAG: DUF4416 family protein [Deltaproteobacteria bacterium]|nr:DUF4416 family protein [Deltaproteobacteria bacterium]